MRKQKNGVLSIVLGGLLVAVIAPCMLCGLCGLLLPSSSKSEPVQEPRVALADKGIEAPAAPPDPIAEPKEAKLPEKQQEPEKPEVADLVVLDIMPRELPTAEDEAEAETRLNLARAFIKADNFQTAKEVLVYLVGEYPGTRACDPAKQLMEAKELAAFVVPVHVRKPRPKIPKAIAQIPPEKRKPEPQEPRASESKSIGFLPIPGGNGGTVNVRGYYRKDGTYVRPHTRHAPRR